MIDILFEDRDILVCIKPAGLLSEAGGADASLPSALEAQMSGEGRETRLFAVHRLDREVSGVMVFAKNQAAAADLSRQVADRSFEKTYMAVVEGVPALAEDTLTDLLFKDSRKNKSFVVDRKRAGVKEASLEYVPIAVYESEKGKKTLVKVKLHTGRYHQIRAQLSSRKLPIVGDGKYGSRDNGAKLPALFAFRLAFEINGKKYEFEKMPDTENYPWSLFNYD